MAGINLRRAAGFFCQGRRCHPAQQFLETLLLLRGQLPLLVRVEDLEADRRATVKLQSGEIVQTVPVSPANPELGAAEPLP